MYNTYIYIHLSIYTYIQYKYISYIYYVIYIYPPALSVYS